MDNLFLYIQVLLLLLCDPELLISTLGNESLLHEALPLCVLRFKITNKGWYNAASNLKAQGQSATGMFPQFE